MLLIFVSLVVYVILYKLFEKKRIFLGLKHFVYDNKKSKKKNKLKANYKTLTEYDNFTKKLRVFLLIIPLLTISYQFNILEANKGVKEELTNKERYFNFKKIYNKENDHGENYFLFRNNGYFLVNSDVLYKENILYFKSGKNEDLKYKFNVFLRSLMKNEDSSKKVAKTGENDNILKNLENKVKKDGKTQENEVQNEEETNKIEKVLKTGEEIEVAKSVNEVDLLKNEGKTFINSKDELEIGLLEGKKVQYDTDKLRNLFKEGKLFIYFTSGDELKALDEINYYYFQEIESQINIALGDNIGSIAFGIKGSPWYTALLGSLGSIFYIVIIGYFIYFVYSSTNIKLDNKDLIGNEDLGDVVEMGGNDGLKKTMEEIIKLNKVNGKIETVKGILLYGPPGTGKTLFGKSIAKKLNIPFKYISSGAFANKFYGGTKDIVKNLFSDIRKTIKKKNYKNLILFLDELDSIGRKRDGELGSFSSDGLNQMLTEIDGFRSEDGIIIIGATNMLDKLDDALVSRFNMKVYVGLPNKEERKDILKNQFTFLYNKNTDEGNITLLE